MCVHVHVYCKSVCVRVCVCDPMTLWLDKAIQVASVAISIIFF